MIRQEGTAANKMRDLLIQKRSNKEITTTQITERMSKMELPKWLISQIIQMVNYRICDRCTCPVEQAMEAAVHTIIVKELMEEEKNQ